MKNEDTKVIIDTEKEYEEIKKTDVKNKVAEPINPFEIKDVTPENKKNGKTKKIIAIVSSVIVLICLVIGIWAIVEKNANKWEIKQNEVTVEYGEVYKPTITDFIDNEKYPNVTADNTEIKVNASYEIDLQAENKPMAYYAVGDYDIDVIHKVEYKLFGATIFTMDETKKVKLSINDTIAPVFAEDAPTELETYKDCEIENIEEKFKATDIAPVTISIDKDNIDYATVGEYVTNVYALDKYDNVANKEIKIKVLEPTVEVDKTSLNMTVGDTGTITATVNGKDQTVEWASSDESVAKVENGNITANKAGNAKITAKANGVETSCEITVAEKAVALSNNRSTRNANNSSSNNSSRPASNGGSSSSSNNGGSSSSNNNTPTTNGCANGNHSMGVGDIGRWFNSKAELQSYVSGVIAEWREKRANGEITLEEYNKNAPTGYSGWSCANCGKWTGNFKYR